MKNLLKSLKIAQKTIIISAKQKCTNNTPNEQCAKIKVQYLIVPVLALVYDFLGELGE